MTCDKESVPLFQGVATSVDTDRLKKRSINVYRSHVKIVGYNSPGYKVFFGDNIFSAFAVYEINMNKMSFFGFLLLS